MLRRLIAFSLDHAALVLIAAAALTVYSLYHLPRLPLDVFPELDAPRVVVLSEAGGLAADEVEQYVTAPIEGAVGGLPGVRRVRSGSALGLSLVYVEFGWGADVYRARQVVAEALATTAARLPVGVHTELAPASGIAGEVMLLALSSPDGRATPLELRAFAEFDLRQRLLSVPGVAQVVAIGGELPEYQVDVRQESLRLHGLTLEEVVAAARQAHSTASAGYLPDVHGMEVAVRQQAAVRSVEDIRGTVVRYREGTAVMVGEVADVRLGPAPPRGAAARAGRPAVVLSVKKAPHTNTVAMTAAIDRALDQVEAGLPAGVTLDRHVMRQADFIGAAVRGVTRKLRDASVIVAVIVLLFLLDVRASVITLIAIPLSLATGVLFLAGLDMTLNVMTLGGLAIAVGEVVDDAIIDVENITRRLRDEADLPPERRRPRLHVIYAASNEVRSVIVFATLMIVVVFAPLLFLGGLEGRFFRPMGVAYVVAILASLLVAVTVVPAMARYLLRAPTRGSGRRGGPLARWSQRAYAPALRLTLRARGWVLAAALAATLGSVALASTFGRDFLPSFNEGHLTVFIDAPPGTSLAESDRMVRGVDRRLSEIDGVRAVVRRTGRAERDEHAHGVNRSEVDLSLDPGTDLDRVTRRVDAVLADLPGLRVEIGAPIGHQLSHLLSGTQASVAIDVFGEDLAGLRRVAEDIEAALRDVPGVRDVLAHREAAVESLAVRYRRQDLARWGLTPAAAAEQVEAAFHGVLVGSVGHGLRWYDLVVRLHPDERRGPEDVRQLLLRGRGGARVRLSEVADVGPERTPLGIQREGGRRKAVVSLNVARGHNLGHVVEAVRVRVDPIVQRYGYAVAYGGQHEAERAARRTLQLSGAFACLAVLALLTLAIGSLRAALLVMVNLPLALIGGVLAIYVSEGGASVTSLGALLAGAGYRAPVISIASMVGFVALFGIAARNGLLLVKHYGRLLAVEGLSVQEAVVRGSMERLTPILMTALTAMLGLAPLALARGQPGAELLSPIAVVILGGLVSSTVLNLFVVPAGYSLLFERRPPRLDRGEGQVWRLATEAPREGDDQPTRRTS